MRNNWERNRIIRKAVPKILETADSTILNMKRGSQVMAVLELRHKLAEETGCDFDTTGRHLTLRSVLRFLQKRTS